VNDHAYIGAVLFHAVDNVVGVYAAVDGRQVARAPRLRTPKLLDVAQVDGIAAIESVQGRVRGRGQRSAVSECRATGVKMICSCGSTRTADRGFG